MRRRMDSLSSEGTLAAAAFAFLLSAGPLPAQPAAADSATCAENAPGQAGVAGAVLDRGTGLPLPGALVSLHFLASDSVNVRQVRTGDGGRFQICALPAGVAATVSATRDSISSGGSTLFLAQGDPEWRELRLPLGAAGRISGVVRARDGGRLLSGARVAVPELEVETLTGDRGRFELPSLPPGRYSLQVSHLSYGGRTDSVQVRSRQNVRVALEVATRPVEVDPVTVRVEGTRSRWLAAQGFYRRMQRSGGEFITREEILERDPARLSHMFRPVSGVQVRDGHLMMKRAPASLANFQRCRLQYFINGQAADLPMGVDTFQPDDVLGIEIYRGASQVPAMYNERRAACGAVVLWLRMER